MHGSCRKSFEDTKKKYPEYFTKKRVLELGSHEVGLFIRSMFTECDYTGVDKFWGYGYRHGDEDAKKYGVDVFADAKETKFDPQSFDVLVCASMFEHDEEWRLALKHNLQWIKKDGLIILEWGAEGNQPHDSHWKPVLTQDFFHLIKWMPITILDSYFEADRFPPEDCPGAFFFIGKKQ